MKTLALTALLVAIAIAAPPRTEAQDFGFDPPTEATDPALPPGTTFAIGMPGPWAMPPRHIQPTTMQFPTGVSSGVTPTVDGSMVARYDTRVNTLVGGPISGVPSAGAPRGPHSRSRGPHSRSTANGDPADGEVWLTERDIRMEEPALAQPPEPSKMLRTIVTDDAYRAQRLTELIRRAAEAASDGER